MSVSRNGTGIQFASPQELLLLRAALLEKPEAQVAAMVWLDSHQREAGPDFRQLESGSRRLLPLVYRNVKGHLSEEARSQLRQVYLDYWSKNQKVFHRLEEFLTWFKSRGIPTLVLKGVALSVLHYRDSAVRPMSDFDVLVPEEHAREAIVEMQRQGWISTYISWHALQYEYVLRHIHAVPLAHPKHGELDLHWHVLTEATFRGADHPFWNASVPLTLNGVTTRALNPTDQLLHACVHGYRANVVAPIRWIADAYTVLRTSQIDWTRLARLGKELRVTIPLHDTLAFLRDTFSAAIPEEVIGEMAAFQVRSSEQRYFQRLCNTERTWQEIFADNCERHRRANRDVFPVLRLATLPRQFQLHYNLSRLRNLGSFAFSLAGKRIRRKLGSS